MRLNLVAAVCLIVFIQSARCWQTVANGTDVNSLQQSDAAIGPSGANQSSAVLSIHKKDNCTPLTIDDFPSDSFTRQQRQEGWVIIHLLLTLYTMMMICIVVDEYFVPSLEIIADRLNLSPDVAGATIMALGTSAPELFINGVGTFITQGDIGIGTVVGSAVFNILAAPAYCGLFSGIVISLDWYSLTRDCAFYGTVVIVMAVFLSDGLIFWYEATVLIVGYGFFILVMYFNRFLEKRVTSFVRKCCCCLNGKKEEIHQVTIINHRNIEDIHNPSVASDISQSTLLSKISEKTIDDKTMPLQSVKIATISEEVDNESQDGDEGPVDMLKCPEGSLMKKLMWLVLWPGNLLLFLTVPDVRRGGKWRQVYLLSFLVCVSWIGILSYLVTWFITVIGDTIGFPDSAMGITFLAAGGSVPEAVALVVVARQGNGRMGVSGCVGSNSIDLMICMGVPWLIKALAFPKYPDEGNFVVINSGGVIYSVMMLFTTVLILYFSIAFNKFRLDRKVGFILLISYVLFLVLAAMFELNQFIPVNPPSC